MQYTTFREEALANGGRAVYLQNPGGIIVQIAVLSDDRRSAMVGFYNASQGWALTCVYAMGAQPALFNYYREGKWSGWGKEFADGRPPVFAKSFSISGEVTTVMAYEEPHIHSHMRVSDDAGKGFLYDNVQVARDRVWFNSLGD